MATERPHPQALPASVGLSTMLLVGTESYAISAICHMQVYKYKILKLPHHKNHICANLIPSKSHTVTLVTPFPQAFANGFAQF